MWLLWRGKTLVRIQNGFEYSEVNIEHDEKARDMIVGLGYRSVPRYFTMVKY